MLLFITGYTYVYTMWIICGSLVNTEVWLQIGKGFILKFKHAVMWIWHSPVVQWCDQNRQSFTIDFCSDHHLDKPYLQYSKFLQDSDSVFTPLSETLNPLPINISLSIQHSSLGQIMGINTVCLSRKPWGYAWYLQVEIMQTSIKKLHFLVVSLYVYRTA